MRKLLVLATALVALFCVALPPAAANPAPKPSTSQAGVIPGTFFGLGATVYNNTPYGIGIGHYWSDTRPYDTILPPRHWSDEYYQNCQAVYVGNGWGYGLDKQVGDGYRTWWSRIAAGTGPARLNLKSWVRYQITIW